MPNSRERDKIMTERHTNRSEHYGVDRNHHPSFLGVVVWGITHLNLLLDTDKHSDEPLIRSMLLNSLSKNGKQKDEAQGDDSLSLGTASDFNLGRFFALAKNSCRYIVSASQLQVPLKLPRRVSPFSPKGYVSGGTSPQTRTSDPSKCCTRLWTQLTALYGAISARISRLGALYLVTGRVGYDKSHGQLYGDLILCSSTAWYSLGTGDCGRRNIAERKLHG